MRRLGRELGVEGPALYTYVTDKDELLDAIGDRVLDVLELDLPGRGTWQERVRASVQGWADMQERHPGGFPLIYRGPKEKVSRTTEELLDALRTAGFDEAGAALAYQTVISFLDGALLEWPRETYAQRQGLGADQPDRRSRDLSAHGRDRTTRGQARLGRDLLDRLRAADARARVTPLSQS